MYLLLTVALLMVTGTGAPHTNENSQPPLLLSKFRNSYYYPNKAIIDKNQRTHFYYEKETDLRYFCPIPSTDDQTPSIGGTVKATDFHREYCLLKQKFKKGVTPMCSSHPRPIILKVIEDNKHVRCGNEQLNGKLYKFGYEICLTKSSKFKISNLWSKKSSKEISEIHHPTIYEFCFDGEQSETIYTKHKIMYPALLANLNLQKENDPFVTASIELQDYGIPEFEHLSKVWEALQPKSHDTTKEPIFLSQLLVSHEDFAFGHWKKSTFHQVNVRPMWEPLKTFWNILNSAVTKKLIDNSKNGNEFDIYTIAHGVVLSQDEKPFHIGPPEDGVVPPYQWLKIIHSPSKKQAVVVILTNVPYAPDVVGRMCSQDLCDLPRFLDNRGISFHAGIFEYAYCCGKSSILQVAEKFNIELNHNDIKEDLTFP